MKLRYIKKLIILSCIPFLTDCTSDTQEKKHYAKQIGDTVFNSTVDSPAFTFCDSSNVLHKRAYIRYTGGWKTLENKLLKKYTYDPSYKKFTGYFIVRFAVNCLNQTGRFRVQIVDSNFKQIESPVALKEHIMNIVKELDGWTHPIYKGHDYDGYTFMNIKINNGQLIAL